MNPLAIKCYLPGRRTQYVLYPTEDMSVELGAGADLCPRGFDDGFRVQFRLVSGQWFVVPQLGQIALEGGALIEGAEPVSPPMMLTAGSATLVLDSSVDPRLPARVVQGKPEPSSAPAEPLAPHVYAAPRVPAKPHTAGPAPTARRAVQPPVATVQPALGGEGRAPVLRPTVPPSVVVEQAEDPAVRELTQTRILDMSHLGVLPQASIQAADGAEQTGWRTVLRRVRGNRRVLAYAVLGVALLMGQVVIHVRHAAAERAASAAATPVSSSAAISADAAPSIPSSPPRAAPPADEVEPLAEGEIPNAQRAGTLYAFGDYRNALRQYRALSALPNAAPVFGVIAHSLEQRLRHAKSK